MEKPALTVGKLSVEASQFAHQESTHREPSIYGVDNGKTIGTYLEHKFQACLRTKYRYTQGSSAKGIDFPDLSVDMKVTSIKQPQSSCPYKSYRHKNYVLGYELLVFVYNKTDHSEDQTATLNILHAVFIEAHRTSDFQTTRGLTQILDNDGNADDLVAYLNDRNLPVDDIQAYKIAEELLESRPPQGYLTISNALQWRLQYSRVIDEAGRVNGIIRIR